MAEFLRDELFDFDGLPGVVGAVVVVGVALGDELVAFREALVCAFGGLPERDEVVEGGLGLGERSVVFAPKSVRPLAPWIMPSCGTRNTVNPSASTSRVTPSQSPSGASPSRRRGDGGVGIGSPAVCETSQT